MQIRSKFPNTGATIFTTMSKMAVEYKAINLGQGFPDFQTDQNLISLVTKAMSDGFNQYPSMIGVHTLREVISDKISKLYGHRYNPETEITITSGATEGIMSTILAAVGAGDEVIVLEPSYDCYLPAIKLSGAKAVSVPMDPPNEERETFQVNWEKVKANITSKTKMLIVNFPHNPTGAVANKNDLDELENIVQHSEIMILSDEVYEHIIFDQITHLSLSTRPALAERTFVISSFGKTTHTTGWKIGYVCAPEKMTAEVRKVHQFVVFTVPSIMQHALAEYTKDKATYLNLPAFYQQKRDRLKAGLEGTRFKALPCPGTFFMLADYSEISALPEAEFSIWMTKEHGVTVIPVSAFYKDSEAKDSNHKIVRFCFAKKEETLDEAIRKLKKI